MHTGALLNSFVGKVISAFDISLEELQSQSRKSDLCDIRKILAYELRQGGYTLDQIGQLLKRDHSTILYNIGIYDSLLLNDKNFKEKFLMVERLKGKEMNIILKLDNSKLLVLNNSMQGLDSLELQSQPRHLKSSVSICTELRTELLQKAVKRRQKDKPFLLKLPYYKADALWQYLTQFEIFFPDDFGPYETNSILLIKNELHRQLQ